MMFAKHPIKFSDTALQYIQETRELNLNAYSSSFTETYHTGEISLAAIEQITSLLKTNTSIERLDLSSQRINKTIITNLTEVLRTNSLKTLTLYRCKFNNIGTKAMEAFANALAVNTSLTKLDLSNLNARTVKLLTEGLAANHTLKTLFLNYCEFGSKGVEAIATLLANNQTITHLNLDANNIDAKAIVPIAKILATNTTLTHLELNENPLRQLGIITIVIALASNPHTSLTLLSLSHVLENYYTEFYPITINVIAALLKTNKSLYHIGLTGTLTDDTYITFINALKDNKNIVHIAWPHYIYGGFGLFTMHHQYDLSGPLYENYKAAKSLFEECKSYLATDFANLSNEIVNKIAERKVALNAFLECEPINDEKEKVYYAPLKTLVNHSHSIKKSWDGYRDNPLRQLGVVKTPSATPSQQPAVTGFYDLPLDLQKHIFSYLPLQSFAHPPAKNYIATPDIASMPSEPTIGAASQIEANQASSQPAQTSLLSKFVTRIKNFFTDLFHCFFPCASTRNASKEISKPKEEQTPSPHAHQPNQIPTPSTSRNQAPVGYFSAKLQTQAQSATIQTLP